MKTTIRKIQLIIILLFASFCVHAQELQEVIYLKDGSIIRGTIIEQIPNTSLKIQTRDNSIIFCQMTEVVKITKEPIVNSKHKPSQNKKWINKGYRGFVDIGYTIGVGDYGNGVDRPEFSTSHGYQFCPYIFAGAGVGAHYYFDAEVVEIPIFAHIRSEFLNKPISPFVDFKVGYSVYDVKGFYMNPSIGCRFALGSKYGLNFSVGYSMQRDKIFYMYDYHIYRYGSVTVGGISLHLGFDF